jgi:hypothetical protein
MTDIDLTQGFELHNVTARGGKFRTRKAFVSLHTPTAGTLHVGAFTLESAFTTEPWHYLFEQSTTTGIVTLRVFTEEFVEMFNFSLGPLQKNAVITKAVVDNEIMINSPSFSAPLFGQVGGGIITATKTASIDPDTTAIDIPQGHICTFGGRMPIAQGPNLFYNDPEIDPRTYVGENVVSFDGSILDIFQASDGALYIFTTNGVFAQAADALGLGQDVTGFISRIPNINTSRSRNAIASVGNVIVLQKDNILLLGNGGAQTTAPIDLLPYEGRRYFSQVVNVEDLRLSGELFATPSGFVCGLRAKRGFFLQANLIEHSFHWVWSKASSFNVVGTLRTRDGEPLIVLDNNVITAAITGKTDHDGGTVTGVIAGKLPLPVEQRPVIRRVTTSSANIANNVGVAVDGRAKTTTAPTKPGDVIIGTSLWSAGTAIAGRQRRTVRTSFDTRSSDPNVELVFESGDRRIGSSMDVAVNGIGTGRRDQD